MTPERWQQVKSLFDGALDQPASERRQWLQHACGDDTALLSEVEALLDVHTSDDVFLEQPAVIDSRKDAADLDQQDSPSNSFMLPPGSRLGSYEIVEELGQGGMGIVYLATDHRLGRRVALKLVGGVSRADLALRERLRREARAAATISHPAVATIYALEDIDGRLFIVSEYVHGRTLRSEIDRGPMDAERAVAIAREVARGLAAAHDAGVVHRDLKPENVLVSDDGQVKVIDFGIAYIEDTQATRLTQEGGLLGTPAYMAPEQLLGTVVDARADIYAFGLLLAEMLTGMHPMRGNGATTPPVGTLGTVIARCLQTDPANRFQSARDLLRALEDTSVSAREGGGGTKAAIWWWQFHQGAASVVYGLMLIPVWRARESIGGSGGRALFVMTLAVVMVADSLRLHLWFTSRFYPAELGWARRKVRRWLRVTDWLFVLCLGVAAIIVEIERSTLAVLLLAVAVATTVAFTIIEPATTRAAFRGSKNRTDPPRSS